MTMFGRGGLAALLTLAALGAHAAEVQVAVAANFALPLDRLAAGFGAATGHTLKSSAGATGKFYAQILAGAPFDVLIAADDATPKRLVAEGHALAGSRFTYAIAARGPGRGRGGPSAAGPQKVHIIFNDVAPGTSAKPVIVWRNARIVTRAFIAGGRGNPAAGAAAGTPPPGRGGPGPVISSRSLREMLSPDAVEALSFGKSPDGSEVGPDDFATTGPVSFTVDVPAGNTNVTIGMAWAWQTLSPVAPMNAPEPQPDLDKVIILLTDGENTQNRWSTSTSSIDSRTQKVCQNAKADNIKVYTVRVIDGNGSLLKNCATKPDMYYDVDEADQLNVVFKSIAQNLANLRIAK